MKYNLFVIAALFASVNAIKLNDAELTVAEARQQAAQMQAQMDASVAEAD